MGEDSTATSEGAERTGAEEPRASKLDVLRDSLLGRIEKADKRLARRAIAVDRDLLKGQEAAEKAETARLFVSQAAKAPRGTKVLRVTDWSTGEAVEQELAVDPDKRPLDQVEALFGHARRLKRGALVARQRLRECAEKRERLRALREIAVAAVSMAELQAAIEATHLADPTLLPADTAAPVRGSRPKQAPRLSYRTFLSPSGARLLVGRGSSDNDDSTLHVARPRDLWLHVQGQSGAHVVVPLMKGHDAPADVLVDAAHLAAHFSNARGEALVEVTYAPRRYVRKPRGSPPGLVVVDREKTLMLRVDAARLAALLAREDGG